MEFTMSNLINEPSRLDFDIPSGKNLTNHLMFRVGGDSHHLVNLSFGIEITEAILGSELTFTSVHENPNSVHTEKVILSELPFHMNWLSYHKIKELYVSAPGPLKGWYALIPTSYPTYHK
ncbi:hypothetical protein PDQ79_30940 [Bacillus cereus]|nr:hypothetical protein [Bacillus cereus]